MTVTIGRASSFFEDATRLRALAEEYEELGAAVRAIDLDAWTGEAAETFAETHHVLRRSLFLLADGVAEVAQDMDRHADVIAWAERMLDHADVGTAAEVAELMHEVDVTVARSARRLARVMQSVADRTPAFIDFPSVAWHFLRQQSRGTIEASLGLLEDVWRMSAARRLVDPLGATMDTIATVDGALAVLKDPVAAARVMSDVDTWRTNPLRAAGRTIPDALLSATGAGSGTAAMGAARRGMSAARSLRLAKREAEARGQTVEGQRTPGTITTDGWAVPEWLAEAARKVPEDWGVALTNRSGIGFRWFDQRASSGVRIDEGAPDHPLVSQRVHHVVVIVEGKVRGRDGLPVEVIQEDPVRAHIPLEEWMSWPTWSTP